jgi:hypothetical protein
MNQVTVSGITYNIKAEISMMDYDNIQRKCGGYYISSLLLVRPKGHKEFFAMRDKFGNVTLG